MKHIKSYRLFESTNVQQELLDLVQRWVLGNEQYYRFKPEDGERLVSLVEQNPWIREESRAHLAKSGAGRLWRGLHEEWNEEYADQLGGSLFSSYSSSRAVAANFGSGDLLSIPVKEAIRHMLISIEWAAGWLGVRPLSTAELEKFEAELDSGGIDDFEEDSEERWFRYMAWEQREYLILNQETVGRKVTSRQSAARWESIRLEPYEFASGERVNQYISWARDPNTGSTLVRAGLGNPGWTPGVGPTVSMTRSIDLRLPLEATDEEILRAVQAE
jgi:hypothetical protein